MNIEKPILIKKRTTKQGKHYKHTYKCPYCDRHFECLPGNINSGRQKSCGCYNIAQKYEKHKTHGGTHTHIYNVYRGIKCRCNVKSSSRYKYYGGRGIENRFESFEHFRDWAFDNGYDKSLSIDRINNDGHYEPDNCRWVTQKEQARNQRTSVFFTYKGQTKTLPEFAEIYGVTKGFLQNRINRGWGIEKAIEIPFGMTRKDYENAR